ncbi:MAG: tRNA lysidine(34) synthetase TilS [Bdellovibrionales bacterium]|nr:tRNA lysidine(34) synthetase TilS [Bdellovibrionales bacterium]
MEEKFIKAISTILPNYRKHKYLLAVSGGVDSMVLADLVIQIVPSSQLIIAHFNHRTRDEESDQDAFFVEQYANKKKVAFELGHRVGNKTSEGSLRLERLNFFDTLIKNHDFDFVLLGHHLQDQLETFLMRIIRGTGLDGLGAMEPKNGVLVRPLLGFSKQDLETEAQRRGIEFRVDSSNNTEKYFRNNIRLNLIPQFEKLALQYGGKEKWLHRLSPLLQEIRWAKKELNVRTKKKLMGAWTETPFWLRLAASFFYELEDHEQLKSLRIIISTLQADTFSAKEIKQLQEAIKKNKKNHSAPGVSFSRSCGFLYFMKNTTKPSDYQLKFKVDGNLVECAPLGLILKFKGKKKGVEWRQYRPGDRFCGNKVKKYFLKKGIPRPERSLIPVLAKCDSNEVLWLYPELHEEISIQKLAFPFAVKGIRY